MDYNEIKIYLKNNLPTPSLQFVWREKDSREFLHFIKRNAPKDFLSKKENLLQIKEAFAFYFQPVGYILFKINREQVRLKVFPYTVDPKKSKNITKIINIIEEHPDSVLQEYHGKKDQIYIEHTLRDQICDYTKSITDEKVNAKELVRFSVRQALSLKDQDLIMLKSDCIFVKLCDTSKRHKVTQEELNTIANRYNGLTEEEMITFNREHFSNKPLKEIKTFFLVTAKLFIEKYFLKYNINNFDYEKRVFPYVLDIITKQLINKFDNCEEFFKGFAGYLFRMHFEEVFSNIAELILIEIANSNENMIDFLKYYSLDIIVIEGKKYRVPNLETDGELRWNVSTMLSIVKIYIRTMQQIKELQSSIDDKDTRIISLSIDGLTPLEYNEKITLDIKKHTEVLLYHQEKLDRVYDSLKLTKSPESKQELQDAIRVIKKQIQGLQKEKSALLQKVVTRFDLNNFIQLDKEVNSLQRTLAKEKKILEQNRDSFLSIKNALVKALISKKRLA